MGTGVMLGPGNPAMDLSPVRLGVEILQVAPEISAGLMGLMGLLACKQRLYFFTSTDPIME